MQTRDYTAGPQRVDKNYALSDKTVDMWLDHKMI